MSNQPNDYEQSEPTAHSNEGRDPVEFETATKSGLSGCAYTPAGTFLRQSLWELVEDRRDGKVTHSEVSNHLKQLVKKLKTDFDFESSVADLKSDLGAFTEVLAKQSDELSKRKLTDEQKERAEELGSEDLLAEWKRALWILGYVADDYTTLALMHTVYARLLPYRTGWYHYGRSRSGKSAGLEAACRLLDKSSVLRATSMTTGALYGLGFLDHVFMLGGELYFQRSGQDDPFQQVLRQFLSEPILTHRRLEESSSESGTRYKTSVTSVSGFASIAWTGTKHPQEAKDEFALRLTHVPANERADTTRRVQEMKAERALNPLKHLADEKEVTVPFKELDLSLKPLQVAIPFANEITLNNSDTTARGTFSLLLQHIQISALYNQHQRRRSGSSEGVVVADWDDYAAAFELVNRGAYRVMDPLSNEARNAYQKAKEEWPEHVVDTFSQQQLAQFLNKPISTVQTYLYQWERADLAECTTMREGRRKLYTFVDNEIGNYDLGLVDGTTAKSQFKEKSMTFSEGGL